MNELLNIDDFMCKLRLMGNKVEQCGDDFNIVNSDTPLESTSKYYLSENKQEISTWLQNNPDFFNLIPFREKSE